ncbi:MAG: 2-amino-4,5-dihydroxy-6-one-heptanoic acid-7-phosphate synthase [Xanthobacteraceae bacterium]|nr:2-amino-4,5-dihydroxy-6-one-heptanoic acid-7-phosphate synthase [Xanthobacteraceae bacterium]
MARTPSWCTRGGWASLNPLVYERIAVVVHISASTRYAPDPNYKYQVGDAEDCLRRGADAISVHVNLGSVTEDQQIRMMANTADACDRAGLPLIAMIYPRGPGVTDRSRLETVMHAAALAADLGVDIVKLPLGGPIDEMRQVVASCPIPIVTAGGAQVPDVDFNQFVANVMKAGARGIAAGRNIFMSADPTAKVREVRKLLDANYVGAPIRASLAGAIADQTVQAGGLLHSSLPLLDQRGVNA